mmetsp:Transcript_44221/g.127796  ORF Transcript_44221/g.127796 Transcript_44221/m.127796 type:complete len:318 (+) Transcript_44221:1179-2132(+)
MVRRVVVLRARRPPAEVVGQLRDRAMVHDLAIMQDDHVVKHGEDLRGRLVDGAEHRHPGHGQVLQRLRQGVGRVGVQPAQWLVQEEHLRVRDKLYAHGHTLLLSAGDAFQQRGTHDRVSALVEAESLQHRIDQGGALFLSAAASHVGGETDALAGRLRGHQAVVLHDVRDVALERLRRYHLARYRNCSAQRSLAAPSSGSLPPGEDIQQRALPASRRPKHSGQAAGFQDAGDAFQNLFLADGEGYILPLHGEASAASRAPGRGLPAQPPKGCVVVVVRGAPGAAAAGDQRSAHVRLHAAGCFGECEAAGGGDRKCLS